MSYTRNQLVQSFLDCLLLNIKMQSEKSPGIATKAINIIAQTNVVGSGSLLKPNSNLPGYRYFSNSIEKVKSCDPPLPSLAVALENLADSLSWYLSTKGETKDFNDGHVNAQILGPLGLEVRNDLIIGVSLMAPYLTYPFHNHAPEEIYMVLSQGEWCQSNKRWFSPGYGGLVFTPSNVFHSMRADNDPLLTIWCLNSAAL